MVSSVQNNILELRDLAVSFGRGTIQAVRGLDFTLSKGEVVGLVGESGSGKSLTAFSIMGLLPHGAVMDRGEIIFNGQNLASLNLADRRSICGRHIGMVFQEPLTALNPVLTIGEQVAEIYRHRSGKSRPEAWRLAVELLGRVGLPNPGVAAKSYPHRFSGGMRQRVVIALALAQNPELVIADEPTTALDPTIAAQILSLLETMAEERGITVLFITHNLRILTNFAKRVLVMYAGLVMEETRGDFKELLHPYTKGLLKALPPTLSEPVDGPLVAIPGQPPSPLDNFTGCPFEPRCSERVEKCQKSVPPMILINDSQRVRCHRFGQ